MKKSELTKEASLPIVNVKHIISKTLKSVAGKPLELILIFSVITTAIGELFGRDYGMKWYTLIGVILLIYVVKDIIDPMLKKEIKGK